jgi:hypothetical protein
MALSKEQVYRSFVKGIITEASPLTFPENTSIDEDNFVLNRDGSRERRLGIDYESNYNITFTGLTEAEIQSGKQSFHSWNTASGIASVSIGVVRIGNRLWFLDMLTDTPSVNLLNGGTYITIAGLDKSDIETAVINTKLVIVSKDLSKPIALSYDSSTDIVTQQEITLEVRDIWGVDDFLVVDDRPLTLSNEHAYNLRNQGWSKSIKTDDDREAIRNYQKDTGRYPSNADNWTLGRNTDATSGSYEKFQGSRMNRNSIGNSPAPKGALIINMFNRGSSRLTESNKAAQVSNPFLFIPNISDLPLDREQNNISTIASFAGRLFYSGVNSSILDSDSRSPNYSNYVFFTQIVSNDTKLGKCYQEADPTSATINDLIASDGGTVSIPDCTQIIKIVAAKASLLIFGDNGVWELFGDTNGFTATSFQVSKVSTNGIYNTGAVVSVGDGFVYWSKAGIYTLQGDAGSGRFVSQNISISSIQSLFLAIPSLGKANVRGFYDEKENKIRWLYNDNDDYSTSNYINSYNKELIYDLTLQAFYKHSISKLASNSPYVASYVEVPGYSVSLQTSEVLSGTNTVLVGTDTVVINEAVALNKSAQFSLLTIRGTSFTLSKYRNTDYLDWQVADSGVGVDYLSYLVTGYDLFGDLLREKMTPYISFYFKRSETGYEFDENSNIELANRSSCLVQSQWNWANSANSGRWGNTFQAYRLLRNYIPSGVNDPFDYGDSVIVTKSKLRGHGKCLSLKIQSETGKALNLLGWGVSVVATGKV